MKILAIDAATEACSAALSIDGSVISRFEICPQQHSQKLLPFVDDILSEAGVKLSQLDGIAYGQGPGSFTGVRIGVSIAQGLAFAADLPVVGVSSLATMAQQAMMREGAASVVAAIDARMSEIYLAAYCKQAGLAVLRGQEVVAKPETFLNELNAIEGDELHLSVGTGWQTYGEVMRPQLKVQETQVLLPSAEFMLPLAVDSFSKGQGQAAEFAQPNYVRDEVTWQKLPGR